MPGRIRIEVDGVELDSLPWFTKKFLTQLINNAKITYKNPTITISTDEQLETRSVVNGGRRGVGDIIHPGTDEDVDSLRRSA